MVLKNYYDGSQWNAFPSAYCIIQSWVKRRELNQLLKHSISQVLYIVDRFLNRVRVNYMLNAWSYTWQSFVLFLFCRKPKQTWMNLFSYYLPSSKFVVIIFTLRSPLHIRVLPEFPEIYWIFFCSMEFFVYVQEFWQKNYGENWCFTFST